MRIEETRKIAGSVEGWLTDREAELLYRLAKKCTGRGGIVEIGSWKGKSTIWLASGSKSGKKTRVYAIDPHTGSSEHKKAYGKVWTFEQFKKNIKRAGLSGIVKPIVKTSVSAAKSFHEPVELVFIDGAHEYRQVKADFEAWFPKVIDGGTMAFHDTTFWPGPRRVVKESLFNSRRFKDIGFIDSITFATKVRENSAGDRTRNKYVLLLKSLYESSARLNLPAPVKRIGKKIAGRVQ